MAWPPYQHSPGTGTFTPPDFAPLLPSEHGRGLRRSSWPAAPRVIGSTEPPAPDSAQPQPYGGLFSGSLLEQARKQAAYAFAPYTAQYQQLSAQQQQLSNERLAQLQAYIAQISQSLTGVAPEVLAAYRGAASDQSLFAKGFSDAVQGAVQQSANQDNTLLGQIGAPSGQMIPGSQATGVGDVAYGLGGYIPATSLAGQGARAYADAALLPGIVQQRGLGLVSDFLGQAQQNQQDLSTQYQSALAQQPGQELSILGGLRSQQAANKKIAYEQRVAAAKLAYEQHVAAAKQGLAVATLQSRNRLGVAKLESSQAIAANRIQSAQDIAAARIRSAENIAKGRFSVAQGNALQAKADHATDRTGVLWFVTKDGTIKRATGRDGKPILTLQGQHEVSSEAATQARLALARRTFNYRLFQDQRKFKAQIISDKLTAEYRQANLDLRVASQYSRQDGTVWILGKDGPKQLLDDKGRPVPTLQTRATRARLRQQASQNALSWARIYGTDPATGQLTIEGQKAIESATGYLVDANGNVVTDTVGKPIPTAAEGHARTREQQARDRIAQAKTAADARLAAKPPDTFSSGGQTYAWALRKDGGWTYRPVGGTKPGKPPPIVDPDTAQPLTKAEVYREQKNVRDTIHNYRAHGYRLEDIIKAMRDNGVPDRIWMPIVMNAYHVPRSFKDVNHLSLPRLRSLAVFMGWAPTPLPAGVKPETAAKWRATHGLNRAEFVSWIQAHLPKADAAAKAATEPPPGSPNATIVDYARRQLGQPYVWGGESRAEGGFDCSGLVDWALRQEGYQGPRLTSFTLATMGVSVKDQKLLPGDLIITNNTNHVVIYAGNGQVIASHGGSADTRGHTAPGHIVRLQPLSTINIEDVRRLNGFAPSNAPSDPQKARTPAGARETARSIAASRYNWSGKEWTSLNRLWTRESGWDYTRANANGSGALGIPQALGHENDPGFPPDYATNPISQIVWGLAYIKDSYHTPTRAWAFWRATVYRNPILAPSDLRAKAQEWISKGYTGY